VGVIFLHILYNNLFSLIRRFYTNLFMEEGYLFFARGKGDQIEVLERMSEL
jgi:hypothetical protein